MDPSCISYLPRPYQGDCPPQFHLSTTQQRVRYSEFPPPLFSILTIRSLFTVSAPPTWNTEAATHNITFDTHINSDFSASQSNALDNYLAPQQPRTRSKSDTSTRPPAWAIAPSDPSYNDNRTSVNLNDILPSVSPQPQMMFSSDTYQSAFSNHSPQLGLSNNYTHSQFLSPEMATSLRRVRSDGGGRPSHRHSKSEGGISFPPSAHRDFIHRTAADNSNALSQQFLHPTETVPSIRGHHRRSSSGSRDRGIGGMGTHSTPGSSRASPYPSPKASPLLGYDPLPLPTIPTPQSLPVSPGMGRSRPVSMPAYGASSFGLPPGGIGELGQQLNTGNLSDMDPSLNDANSSVLVSKPNVTTTATAEASERRRKTDANFSCPVPGCGSTFTRHFNLKGVSCLPVPKAIFNALW